MGCKVQRGKKKSNPGSDRRAENSAQGICRRGRSGLRAEEPVRFGSAGSARRGVSATPPRGARYSRADIRHKWRTGTRSLRRGAASAGPRRRRPGQPGGCWDEGLFSAEEQEEEEEERGGRARLRSPARTAPRVLVRAGQRGAGPGRAVGCRQTNGVCSKDLFRKLSGFFSREARLSLCFPSSLSLSLSPFKSHQACNQQQKLT